MRTIEEIKKEQDEAIADLGKHVILAEELKIKIFRLAGEAVAVKKAEKLEPEAPITPIA